IALHEATLRARVTRLGAGHRQTLLSRHALATANEALGRWAEAEGLYREVLARRRQAEQPDSPLLAEALTPLGRNLMNQERWAEPLLRESVAIRQRRSSDDWARYDGMSLLGGVLLGQGRYAEAEPLVVAGYEGIKAREARIAVPERHRLREAAERVVRLYDEW